MDSLSKRFSYRPKRNPGRSTSSRRNRRERFSPEHLPIVPVPREELPDEMKSVLESLILSQRPSLADTRLARSDVQHASTNSRSQSQGSSTQGYERYDYDGRNDYGIHGPNSKWPLNFTFKGKKFPSRTYHTHKVVPRSRPNAREQLGKRKWHPSRRHGRVIQQEDYDTYAARELGQTTQFLNSESLLDLSIRGGRAAKGIFERAVGGSRSWRWPWSGKNQLEKVTGKMFCRG
ncbi:hypothetical protein BDM02DRAFT_3130017 [Thelephora ganbajun]|uniref:Uncharacterized protein n=1 Tax=Thelephora ganbajun TaxID=370292 RepID=A0ACB6ZBT8_THEGA|nr:hypothetical protein BDM02DRAFT_3130017 [Thelephora ganbajun]